MVKLEDDIVEMNSYVRYFRNQDIEQLHVFQQYRIRK